MYSEHVNYGQCTIYISLSMFYLPRSVFSLFNQHNFVIGWCVGCRWSVCLSTTNMINDIALIYFHFRASREKSDIRRVEREKNTTNPLKPFNFELIENLEKLLCHTKPISNQTLYSILRHHLFLVPFHAHILSECNSMALSIYTQRF